MRSLIRSIFFVLAFIASIYQAHATHVRAGEITARRISSTSLTYEITFTGYFDMQNGKPAADAQVDVDIFVGSVGPFKVPRDEAKKKDIGNNTTINIYTFTYTFPAPGRFEITTNLDKRNNNILNIGPAPTQELSFYIKSTLVINASLGQNRTPVLLNAPIDLAAVGQKYIHNPNAYDADGDSLAYRLVVPQEGIAGRPGGKNLQYVDPNQIGAPGITEDGKTPATFGINALTGDLTWDSPATPGYYNVAFVVEEWRNGIKIGEIVRDMQIIVVEARNDRPKLDSIPDLCVEAGTLIQQAIKARDKNGDRLILTTSGGVYRSDLINPQVAQFIANQPNPLGEAGGVFRWQTSCDHIRFEPYDVLFKVEDNAGPNFPNPTLFRKLVDIKTFRIRVYGPRPQNLQATPTTDASGRAFRVTWNNYQCQVPGAQVVVYRKEGCSDFQADACQPGLPPALGYVEVGRVPVGTSVFVDNNNAQGLRRGIKYSYRLVVEFPRPGSKIDEPGYLNGGGSSLPSAEFCLDLPLLVPVITNVTVDSTSTTNGIITVKWTRPIGVDPATLEGPSQYKLFRATGLTGTDFTLVATINTRLLPGQPDTLFVDKKLNTTANAYRYQLEYYFTQNNALVKLEASEPASSVRLEQGSAESRQVRLQWTANVPWMNTNQRHRVYRENRAKPGTYNQIAEVAVQGPETFTYLDDGTDKYAADGTVNVKLSADSVYCYRVETVGTYGNDRIKPAILLNFSQKICVAPLDTIKPCPPVLSLDTLDCSTVAPDAYCNQTTFTNNLSWVYPAKNTQGKDCDPNVVSYKVYYARYADEKPTLLTTILPPPTPPATAYAHTGLSSFAGCYYVTTVNRYGNESAPSNIVCKDNCPQFALPNVFTPNGDGKNDTFQPLQCPTFVETVTFRVFNRWGTKVFETTDPAINWNGKNNGGQDLAAGQYYYEASVTFESVVRPGQPLILKGWIQLLR